MAQPGGRDQWRFETLSVRRLLAGPDHQGVPVPIYRRSRMPSTIRRGRISDLKVTGNICRAS